MTDTKTPAKPSSEVVNYDPTLFAALVKRDPEQAAARIEQRFVQAETLDDLFAVFEGTASKDLAGRVVEVQGVEWDEYLSERGPIPLAVVTAYDLREGEPLMFTTTSGALTMFLAKATILGALPFKAKIAAKKTSSGQTALNFERV
jgi:hypothetical protein